MKMLVFPCLVITLTAIRVSAHAPANGGAVFPGTFFGGGVIKISKLALPGVRLKYE